MNKISIVTIARETDPSDRHELYFDVEKERFDITGEALPLVMEMLDILSTSFDYLLNLLCLMKLTKIEALPTDKGMAVINLVTKSVVTSALWSQIKMGESDPLVLIEYLIKYIGDFEIDLAYEEWRKRFDKSPKI